MLKLTIQIIYLFKREEQKILKRERENQEITLTWSTVDRNRSVDNKQIISNKLLVFQLVADQMLQMRQSV